MMNPTPKPRLRTRIFGPIAAALILASPTLAQEHIREANALYNEIRRDRHSGPIILPALAKIEAPPAQVAELADASLAFPGGTMWPDARAWAEREPQQAVLDALREVTEEQNFRRAMAFAQPYGASDVSVDTIRSGMYTELGDPPLLAAARHLYLPKMQQMRVLARIEAHRLQEEGRPGDAIELLLRLAVFGRQMADRELIYESYFGYVTMIDAMRAARDVLYIDYTGRKQTEPSRLIELVKWLDREGALGLDRLKFPQADRIAAQQVIDTVYEERGGVQPARFLSTMVRLGSSDRPLRRFSEARFWVDKIDTQVDWWDINEQLGRVYESWTTRWGLQPDDPVLTLPFAFRLSDDPSRYAAVIEPLRVNQTALEFPIDQSGGVLFQLREVMEVERVGTRLSMAVVGRYYERNALPPTLAATRPRFVEQIEADAYHKLTVGGNKLPMEYFIPVIDSYVATKRDEATPHTMNVFPGDGTNFTRDLFEDQFVLYSVGPDGADEDALRVHADPNAQIGDYLIWPPVRSLHRDYLRQTGQLR